MDKCKLTQEQIQALVGSKSVVVKYYTVGEYEGYGGMGTLRLIPPEGDRVDEDSRTRS